MAKKKSKQAPAADAGPSGEGQQNATPENDSQTQPQPATTTKESRTSKSPKTTSSTSSSQTLIICRNKHWRFISAFHGPWLQMPMEILETITNINYNTPRPRPIAPAVLFDVTKIRRLVDEATNLAVRAASDISSPIMTNVNGGMPGASSMSALGMGGGHGSKLSRERKFRMREQASQKLCRAYRLDEIACSVATMQGSSPIEEVAGLVLQRNPQDPDAKYVHFFHEKIPSRQLVEFTGLGALTEVISEKPSEAEALRTRAIVRCMKDDFEGAAQDLTSALSVSRFHQPPHQKHEQSQTQELTQGRRRPQDVVLADKDQPTSLEGQLLFLRATAYLTLAHQQVAGGLPPAQEANGHADAENSDGNPVPEANGRTSPEADAEPAADSACKQAESRKLVKTYAKRSLRDFMSFISVLEYAPNLPTVIAKDFNDRVNLAAHGVRNPRPSEATYSVEPYTVYSVADLFAAVPPPDLPPYPSEEIAKPGQASEMPPTCEWTTYHPLLTEALHSLLLCHILVQTSPKELLRHIYMVARLVRQADGFPIFQASRSQARADWMEVLRRNESHLKLSASWETLCAPPPLPFYYDTPFKPKAKVSIEQRLQALQDQGFLDAFDDDQIEKERRAEQDRLPIATNIPPGPAYGAGPTTHPSLRRWSAEEGRDIPVLTMRAAAVSRWLCEAPAVTGTTRRKKRTKKPSKAGALGESVEKLRLEDAAGDAAEP
ncbi:Aminotran-5 domain-containing protein [Fusarium sp. LHS14.1]|nr:Aminotran-5 domain-containing protein [Fusarium sp. LHS14.1]